MPNDTENTVTNQDACGAYFPTTRWTWVGIERFVGAEIVGWRITYRCWHRIQDDDTARVQRFKYESPSRFGAMRAVMLRCRQWHGKVFFLDVQSVEPIYLAHYEWVDDSDD